MGAGKATFGQRSALSFGLRFGGLAIQFVASVLIARMLGPSGYGTYAYAFTVAALTGAALGLGLVSLTVRELPRALARGETDLAAGYMILTAAAILGTAVPALLVLFGLKAAGLIVLGVAWPLVFAAAIVQAFTIGMSSVLNGFQKILQSQFVETVLRQGVYLAIVAALFLGGAATTAEGMFALSLAVAAGMMLVLLWLIRGALREHGIGRGTVPRFATRSWIGAGLPLLAIALLTQLQMDMSVLVIGALGTPADVGLYKAAARGADLVVIANGIALHMLEPMLARALATGDREGAQRLVSQSVLTSVALAAPFAVVLALGAPWYLALFGPEFTAAAPVLRILACGYLLSYLAGPVAVILVMQNRERLVLAVTGAGVALHLTLCLVLVPTLGGTGAALSAATAAIGSKAVLLALVMRKTDFAPTVWTAIRRHPRGRRQD